MKRVFLLLGLSAVLMVTISSCAATMKRDCQGKRHYRTANGIYV
ncbi:MAG TPA: hypothetical protein VNT20_00370 [Flavisolibacter sp.]|nr:hypothetical protein [Flavisolibacter sp.]